MPWAPAHPKTLGHKSSLSQTYPALSLRGKGWTPSPACLLPDVRFRTIRRPLKTAALDPISAAPSSRRRPSLLQSLLPPERLRKGDVTF